MWPHALYWGRLSVYCQTGDPTLEVHSCAIPISHAAMRGSQLSRGGMHRKTQRAALPTSRCASGLLRLVDGVILYPLRPRGGQTQEMGV